MNLIGNIWEPMINQQFFGHPIVRHTHMELVKHLKIPELCGAIFETPSSSLGMFGTFCVNHDGSLADAL